MKASPAVARRAPAARQLTAPVEDYLKAIFDLERAGEPAATSALAARLGLAPASVTGMVRRLAAQGLLTHERYRGVRLTERGRRAALKTLRRHRVIEAYLTRALGYRWDAVDVEAERQRLDKQRQQLLGALKGVEAKLGNENFTARAKPEVVAQTRAKQAELQGQLAAVEKHLGEL